MQKHLDDKLFVVRLNNYRTFYVFARGYDEAADKTIKHMNTDWQVKQILSNDGSLVTQTDEDSLQIKYIELITDEIIF